MLKGKGAIFDFDGTLLDSMFIWDTAGEVYLDSIFEGRWSTLGQQKQIPR